MIILQAVFQPEVTEGTDSRQRYSAAKPQPKAPRTLKPRRAFRQGSVGSDLRADRSSKAAHRKTRSPRRCDPPMVRPDQLQVIELKNPRKPAPEFCILPQLINQTSMARAADSASQNKTLFVRGSPWRSTRLESGSPQKSRRRWFLLSPLPLLPRGGIG
jgi:hypothetical protein